MLTNPLMTQHLDFIVTEKPLFCRLEIETHILLLKLSRLVATQENNQRLKSKKVDHNGGLHPFAC